MDINEIHICHHAQRSTPLNWQSAYIHLYKYLNRDSLWLVVNVKVKHIVPADNHKATDEIFRPTNTQHGAQNYPAVLFFC